MGPIAKFQNPVSYAVSPIRKTSAVVMVPSVMRTLAKTSRMRDRILSRPTVSPPPGRRSAPSVANRDAKRSASPVCQAWTKPALPSSMAARTSAESAGVAPHAHGAARASARTTNAAPTLPLARISHGGMIDQRALHLHGADAVPRDVHDVVDAPQEPEVSVLVALRAVPGEVDARKPGPVLLPVSLRVAVNPAKHG